MASPQMCQMYRHTFVPYAEVTHCTTAVRLCMDCRLQNDLTSNPARSTRATDLVNRAIFVLLTRHKTEKFAVSISALVTVMADKLSADLQCYSGV